MTHLHILCNLKVPGNVNWCQNTYNEYFLFTSLAGEGEGCNSVQNTYNEYRLFTSVAAGGGGGNSVILILSTFLMRINCLKGNNFFSLRADPNFLGFRFSGKPPEIFLKNGSCYKTGAKQMQCAYRSHREMNHFAHHKTSLQFYHEYA